MPCCTDDPDEDEETSCSNCNDRVALSETVVCPKCHERLCTHCICETCEEDAQ